MEDDVVDEANWTFTNISLDDESGKTLSCLKADLKPFFPFLLSLRNQIIDGSGKCA